MAAVATAVPRAKKTGMAVDKNNSILVEEKEYRPDVQDNEAKTTALLSYSLLVKTNEVVPVTRDMFT